MVPEADAAVGLYQRLLGDAADQLAPIVRALHVGTGPVHGLGSLEVGGAHPLASVTARWLGLPPAGSVEPFHLAVVRSSGREVWVRLFADRALVTQQFAGRGGGLVERSGRSELRFRLEVEHGSLHFCQMAAAVCFGGVRVPVPRWLAPQVTGTAGPSPDGCRLLVRITIAAPLLGTILTYGVELEPTP